MQGKQVVYNLIPCSVYTAGLLINCINPQTPPVEVDIDNTVRMVTQQILHKLGKYKMSRW